MGIVSGALSAARFRVDGALPDDWRTSFREKLEEFAFREPPTKQRKEELEGWVLTHNLLENDFSDYNRWLYGDYAVFAIRVDKIRLPQRLFRAHLDRKCKLWAAERGLERTPKAVREQFKEDLEDEWLARALPSPTVVEAVWCVTGGYLLLGGLSDAVVDRFRKRFFRTFGLKLLPWSPLDWLGDAKLVQLALDSSPATIVGGGEA